MFSFLAIVKGEKMNKKQMYDKWDEKFPEYKANEDGSRKSVIRCLNCFKPLVEKGDDKDNYVCKNC